MEIEKTNIHPYAIEELACKIIGLDYDEIDADTDIIEEKLMSDLEVDLSQFAEIVDRLIPLIMVANSPLTEKTYKGFADTKSQLWLAKMEVL